MIHRRGRHATRRESPARIVDVVISLAMCAAWCTSLAAQVPPTLSEGLLRQWDLNRDGKVDAGEAEVARAKMRRSRTEAAKTADIDPVTGRPRAAPGVAGGRAAAQAEPGAAPTADDGGLILVPGTVEQSPASVPSPLEPAAPPPRRERDPLPGTRIPAPPPTIPSVPSPGGVSGGGPGAARSGLPPTTAGGRDPRSGDLNGRARILPDGSAVPAPPQTASRRPTPAVQPPAVPRPGVIAGGSRPSPGSSQSLNAGRLPGGLPQTRGAVPGVASPSPRGPAVGTPGRTSQPYGTQPFGAATGSRGTTARGQVPPGGVPAGAGGAARGMPTQQPAGTPYRSGMRPQATTPSPPPTSAVPRPPRLGPEDYFGR